LQHLPMERPFAAHCALIQRMLEALNAIYIVAGLIVS
jgi:hypothetical protein